MAPSSSDDNTPPDDNDTDTVAAQVLQLKRQALSAKKAGDLETAKALLRKAKQVEASAASVATTRAAAHLTDERNKEEDASNPNNGDNDNANRKSEEQTFEEESSRPYDDPVNKAIDEATLAELGPGGNQLSVSEMLDVQGLQELRDCGLDIPTEQDYHTRAVQCMQQALQHKQEGNLKAAKQSLCMAKQLHAACQQLYHHDDKNVSAAKEELELEQLSAEDQGLLAELQLYNDQGVALEEHNQTRHDDDDDDDLLLLNTDNNNGDLNNHHATTPTMQLDFEDLQDLDAALLRDMMEAGMTLPSLDEVQAAAAAKKAAALEYRKQGNIPAAKAALQESKTIQVHAQTLEALLQAMEHQHKTSDEDDNTPLQGVFVDQTAAKEDPETLQTNKQSNNPTKMMAHSLALLLLLLPLSTALLSAPASQSRQHQQQQQMTPQRHVVGHQLGVKLFSLQPTLFGQKQDNLDCDPCAKFDQEQEDVDLDHREAFFSLLGMAWAAGTLPATLLGNGALAHATYGANAKIELPNPVQGMMNCTTKQCLVESLGVRDCLVYEDPDNKLYQGADSKLLLEHVERAAVALQGIPALVENEKWSQVTGVLTGPLGKLVCTMKLLAELVPGNATTATAKSKIVVVKNDLYAIGAAVDQKQADTALKSHQAATKHLVDFVNAL